MYRIAICDNEPLAVQQNADAIRRILNNRGMEEVRDYDIDLFHSPAPLISRLTGQPDLYQLLLLDVLLDDANGLELAAFLRENQVDISIIYISAFQDYALDSFPTHPVDYLTKPVDEKRLAAALDWDLRGRKEKAAFVLWAKGVAIPANDIFYLEISGHKVAVYTRDDVFYVTETLSALEPKLLEHSFCHSHFSFLVNLAHVKRLGRTEVILENGQTVPISRRYYRSLMEQYLNWLQ